MYFKSGAFQHNTYNEEYSIIIKYGIKHNIQLLIRLLIFRLSSFLKMSLFFLIIFDYWVVIFFGAVFIFGIIFLFDVVFNFRVVLPSSASTQLKLRLSVSLISTLIQPASHPEQKITHDYFKTSSIPL